MRHELLEIGDPLLDRRRSVQLTATAQLTAPEAPCARCLRLARRKAERLACSAAQAFMLGSKCWSLAPRLDATHWRWELLFGQFAAAERSPRT